MKPKDIYPGIIFILVSIVFFFETTNFPNKSSEGDVGPDLWPRVLLTIIILLSIVLIIFSIKERMSQKDTKQPFVLAEYKPLLKSIVGITVSFLFILTFNFVGFFITTTILYVVLGALMSKELKNKWLILVEAVVTVAICYLVFDVVLKVDLPQGLFFI